jgi:hypothetical protein
MPLTRLLPVRLLAIAIVALVVLTAIPAAAQSDTTSLTVGAILCQDADCFDHSTLVPGFTVTAVDSETGDALASCTTDAGEPHLCTLQLPADASWTLTWDDSQVPAGYAWRGDLYSVADGPLGSATLIPFVPVQEPEPTVEIEPTTAPVVIEEPGHITVQAALCTDATCTTFADYLDDFIITAVDAATGEEYSSCATGNLQQGLDHQCILDVPADAEIELTWVEDQVPDGYVSYGNPFPVGTAPAVTTLGFVPTDSGTGTETPAPVTTLPSTGMGDQPSEPPSGMPLLIAGLLVASAGLSRDRRTTPELARQHVRRR